MGVVHLALGTSFGRGFPSMVPWTGAGLPAECTRATAVGHHPDRVIRRRRRGAEPRNAEAALPRRATATSPQALMTARCTSRSSGRTAHPEKHGPITTAVGSRPRPAPADRVVQPRPTRNGAERIQQLAAVGAGSARGGQSLPFLHPDPTRRTGPLDWFPAHRAESVVAIFAPAGYGKTTLLGQATEADVRPFASVSLEGRDNDP
jgi:hypothetical protein